MASITASAVSLQVRDAATRRATNPRASRRYRARISLFARPVGTIRRPHPERTADPVPFPRSNLETPTQTVRARPVAARRASFAGAAVRCARVPQIAASILPRTNISLVRHLRRRAFDDRPRLTTSFTSPNDKTKTPTPLVRVPGSRSRAAITSKTSVRVAPVASSKSSEKLAEKKMPAGFNLALAAMVAGSVFVLDAVSPEYAEAARSSGRMGGSSFRSAPRSAPRGMSGQSRTAPPPQAMRGGMGYGYGSFMPFPMFSPFGFGFSPFGFGFGFGGFGFLIQIFVLLWVVNFVSGLLNSVANAPRNDDDDMGPPPRY